jgi:hypothetical protein
VLRDVLIEKTDFRDIVLTIFVKNSPSGGLMWNQGAGHSLHPQKRKPHPINTLGFVKTFIILALSQSDGINVHAAKEILQLSLRVTVGSAAISWKKD